jgi:hypothetical protein
MRKLAVILSIGFLSLFLGARTPQFAQNTDTGPEKPDLERRARAIGLLRTINTAEAAEASQYGSFASWQTLLAHSSTYMNDWLAKFYAQEAGLQFRDLPEILPDWSLRLNVHADGKGYDVMLRDLASKRCAFAAFTNESGIIWHGKAIDCKIE